MEIYLLFVKLGQVERNNFLKSPLFIEYLFFVAITLPSNHSSNSLVSVYKRFKKPAILMTTGLEYI